MINRLFPLAVLLVIESSAQEFRATLQGTITDPSRAHIAGASLLLKHTATGVERPATADVAGHYVFQFLPPGAYGLTTRAPGFKLKLTVTSARVCTRTPSCCCREKPASSADTT